MKRAFTLIELLAVIAIIAILAAILFPVFARAKSAAKQSVGISNIRQIGTAIQLYLGDSDDILPRNDDCVNGSSLNSALNSRPFNASGAGCAFPPFQYRVNHYAWQKWVMPYVKNVAIFEHPGRQKDSEQWSTHGQIISGYAINIALTGALNTYAQPDTDPRRFRDSWIGGNHTAIPNPSAAMMIMEFPQSSALATNPLSFAPAITPLTGSTLGRVTTYPMAVREVWANMLMRPNLAVTCGTMNSVLNEPRSTVFNGGIQLSMADTSSRFMPVSRFLANTPLASEYKLTPNTASMCGNPAGSSLQVATNDEIDLSIDYPMWALGK